MNPTPFDIFVLPFTVGMSLLFAYLILKYASWIWYFDRDDKLRILRGLFSLKSLKAAKEIFLESLVHRKMFLVNRRLGYMHFSLAFGWFLLIVIGAFEAHIYMGGAAPFYFFLPFYKIYEEDRAGMAYAWHTYTFCLYFLSVVSVWFLLKERRVSQ